jgi:hypothetical protein
VIDEETNNHKLNTHYTTPRQLQWDHKHCHTVKPDVSLTDISKSDNSESVVQLENKLEKKQATESEFVDTNTSTEYIDDNNSPCSLEKESEDHEDMAFQVEESSPQIMRVHIPTCDGD